MIEFIRPLVIQNQTKVVMLSLDGLGGLPRPETGKSELETARIPNLATSSYLMSKEASLPACGKNRFWEGA